MMIDTNIINDIVCDCFCLDKDKHIVSEMIANGQCIRVDGVMGLFTLRVAKLKEHEPKIREFLSELPDDFFADKGGGSSFLNMCNDKHGNQWGEHVDVEALIVLGIGIGCVRYIIEDRQWWKIFPGGLPYIQVNLKGVHDDTKTIALNKPGEGMW
jgi:hypothetical protein